MKRILALLLTAMLLFTASTFAEEENWYLETAKELTIALGELTADEGYLSMYTSQKFDCIESFARNDFSAVQSAWRFDLASKAGMKVIIGAMAAADASMGDLAWEYIYSRMLQMIATQHNSTLSANHIAAASVLNYSRTYIMPEGFKPCAIVLAMEKDISFVTFDQTGAETITATVQPIFCPEGQSPAKVIPTLGLMFAPSRIQLF